MVGGFLHLGTSGQQPSVELPQLFQAAIDLDPSLVESYVGLAKLKLLENDPHSAISTLEKAFQAVGADTAVRELLTTAYRQTGKSPESDEILAFLRAAENGN